MRYFILVLILLGTTQFLKAQIGINNNNPHFSSALDISANNKGILIPRLTLVQRFTIASPAQGLLVFQTNFNVGFYFYDGTSWNKIDAQNNALNDGDGDTEVHTELNNDEDKIRIKLSNTAAFELNNNNSIFKINTPSLLENTFLGLNAGTDNITGKRNVAIGDSCLANMNSNDNTAIGNKALKGLATGHSHTALGFKALSGVTVGIGSTAVGTNALSKNTASFNTAVGLNAMQNMVGGILNTTVGQLTMDNTTSGTQNTTVGYMTLRNNTGTQNTAVGYKALMANTSGSRNTAVGYLSLSKNLTGNDNVAFGSLALEKNLSGSLNTAVGNYALNNLTSGQRNTAVGSFALRNLATGDNNTAMGNGSLSTGTSYYGNTAVGAEALLVNNGDNNTAIGYRSLVSNSIGNHNVALGNFALDNNLTGNSNTAIGHLADVGFDYLSNATAIGANARVDQSNTVVLGGVAGINGATKTSRVLINSYSNDTSVIVNLEGINKGFLLPRMTTMQRNVIATPAEGLTIFNTTTNSIHVFNGTTWDDYNEAILGFNADEGEGFSYELINSVGNFLPGYSQRIIDNDENSFAEVDWAVDNSFTVFLDNDKVLEIKSDSVNNFGLITRIQSGNYLLGENCGDSLRNDAINNIGIGTGALKLLETGNRNVAIGSETLQTIFNSNNNVAIGKSAIENDAINNQNVAIGQNAMRDDVRDYNTAIGYNALLSTLEYNTGIGAYTHIPETNYSTAIGYRAFVGKAVGDVTPLSANAVVLGSVDGFNGATSNVDVGIGTNTPDCPLHILTNSNNDGFGLMLKDSVRNVMEISFKAGAVQGGLIVKAKPLDTQNSSEFSILTGVLGVTVDNLMKIEGNGDITFAGNLTQLSDQRHKKNIKPINNVLPRMLKINGHTFEWKDEKYGIGTQYGLMAQEVEKQFPDAIIKDNGTKKIEQSAMTALLLQALKEEYQKINIAKEKLYQNEQRLASLEKALKAY